MNGGGESSAKHNSAKNPVSTVSQSYNSPCKTPISSPSIGGLSGGKNSIGAIVRTKNSAKLPPKVRVAGYVPTDNIENCALDSGACEAVLAPHAFEGTPTIKTKHTGMKYLACGGEKVTNT